MFVDARTCLNTGFYGPTNKGDLTNSWFHTQLLEAIRTWNYTPRVKPFVHRLGVSLHTQKPSTSTLRRHDDLRRNPGLGYFLTFDPTCLCVFHNSPSDFTTTERSLCLQAIFKNNHSQHYHSFTEEQRRHLHLNCPEEGSYDKIEPYEIVEHDQGQRARPVNARFITALNKMLNDPAMQLLKSDSLGPWTRRTVNQLSYDDWSLYTEHGYWPIDYDVRSVDVMRSGSFDDTFSDIHNPHPFAATDGLPHKDLWQIPLSFHIQPVGITLYRKRSDTGVASRAKKAAQGNFLPKAAAARVERAFGSVPADTPSISSDVKPDTDTASVSASTAAPSTAASSNSRSTASTSTATNRNRSRSAHHPGRWRPVNPSSSSNTTGQQEERNQEGSQDTEDTNQQRDTLPL